MQGSMLVNKAQAFLLKGNAYTLTTLQLNSLDIPHIEATLLDKIKQAPKFFDRIPLVLDLQKLNTECADHVFLEIVNCLRKHRVVPIGLRGGSEGLQQLALSHGLACLSETKAQEKPKKTGEEQLKPVPQEKAQSKTPQGSSTKVITQPVRSGQQIYAPGGDLIVLATVSHGAEILADGNIHVYAPLRGRALAGVMGDPNTYIFCQSLEAELISIAGQYRISEQLKEIAWQKSVQISLADGHLKIDPL